MAEVKFWEEMNQAPSLTLNDKLMIGKGDTGATYQADFNKVRTLFGLNSNSILSADTSTTWEDQDNGLFIPTESGEYVYGDGPNDKVDVDMTEGFTMLQWNGTTLTKILYATRLGTPIKFRISNDEVEIVGGNTVITDDRLKGMTDYPVTTTQLNVSFRSSELSYNVDDGVLTIPSFELQAGEEVVVYPDATGGIGGNNNILAPVEERLTKLEQMVSPMLTRGRMWWDGAVEDIPIGWVEDTEWRGYTPIHASNLGQIGLTVGADSLTLSSTQQGSFQVRAQKEISSGNASVKQINQLQFRPTGGAEVQVPNGGHNTWGAWSSNIRLSAGASPIDLRQRSKYGIWIKYVGV